MKKPIKIYVTTCKKQAFLLKHFDTLFHRFWNGEYIVFGQDQMMTYSDQLIDYFTNVVDDDYFILLHEDFYFINKVDQKRIEDLMEYAREYNVDRIGLQSLYDGYQGATNKIDKTSGGIDMYRITQKHNYICSFEASIWRREFMLKYMVKGENPWRTEEYSSLRARRENNNKVFVTKEKTCDYRDAYVKDTQRIKIINGTFHNLVPGDMWEDLEISP